MAHDAERIARLPTGLELAYDTFGDPADPAILLIMGLSGPLNWWDVAFCEQLSGNGFYVIRYDNRDVGHSTVVRGANVRRADLVRAFVAKGARVPYSMSELAADGIGLLDHLGIEQAHVTGISMGGMIAQTIAIEHPERVLSLVSMMSTTGRRSVGWQDPRLLRHLLASSPRNLEQYLRRAERTWSAIGSPGYPLDPVESRKRAAETYERGVDPAGTLRQLLAILTQPDRTERLRSVSVPTLVVHGLDDRLVHVSGGKATARAVPGAELMLISGMAHDLPTELWPTLIDGIIRTARSAKPVTEVSRRRPSARPARRAGTR